MIDARWLMSEPLWYGLGRFELFSTVRCTHIVRADFGRVEPFGERAQVVPSAITIAIIILMLLDRLGVAKEGRS
jgi:hypothetical protein